MKLIDLLVKELPRRGGWPDGVTHIGQDYDRELRFYGRGEPGTGITLDELAVDHRKTLRRVFHPVRNLLHFRDYSSIFTQRQACTLWKEERGVHMPKRMNMSTVEERLTKVETNLANLADAQRDVSQALNKVSESIHAIQISIERQNASIHQIVELRRDVDAMSKDVDKLKGKVWWLGGVSAACTFIIVNFSRMKDFFH